jgi:hypothetical protein
MRIVVSVVAGALLAGCSVYANPSYPSEPELAYVDDDVYVVADYPEPVFFSAGMYWRYDDGYWYRSRVHTGNWTRVQRVPTAIRRIDRPQTYVRYRPGHRASNPMTRRDDDRLLREEQQRERERAQQQREEARERAQKAREQQEEARERAREEREREKEMRDEAREHDQELRRQEREQKQEKRDEAREDKDKKDDRPDKGKKDDRPDKGNKKDRGGDD